MVQIQQPCQLSSYAFHHAQSIQVKLIKKNSNNLNKGPAHRG